VVDVGIGVHMNTPRPYSRSLDWNTDRILIATNLTVGLSEVGDLGFRSLLHRSRVLMSLTVSSVFILDSKVTLAYNHSHD
jgi:hypothetical protein